MLILVEKSQTVNGEVQDFDPKSKAVSGVSSTTSLLVVQGGKLLNSCILWIYVDMVVYALVWYSQLIQVYICYLYDRLVMNLLSGLSLISKTNESLFVVK